MEMNVWFRLMRDEKETDPACKKRASKYGFIYFTVIMSMFPGRIRFL